MRYNKIDINIKAIPDAEEEALLNQQMGHKKDTVSADKDENPVDTSNADNPGKVASDDPTTVASVYPLQQELELKKKEAGKDLAQFDHINQDADESETDQEARQDPPLVTQPEVTGDNPGVPADMKNKEPKTESEFIQRLKTLSGQN